MQIAGRSLSLINDDPETVALNWIIQGLHTDLRVLHLMIISRYLTGKYLAIKFDSSS